eukprot:1666484-Rhodomonas_salina.4
MAGYRRPTPGRAGGYPSLDVGGFTVPESAKVEAEKRRVREEKERMEMLRAMEIEMQEYQLQGRYEHSEAKLRQQEESAALKENFEKVGIRVCLS